MDSTQPLDAAQNKGLSIFTLTFSARILQRNLSRADSGKSGNKWGCPYAIAMCRGVVFVLSGVIDNFIAFLEHVEVVVLVFVLVIVLIFVLIVVVVLKFEESF